ncbi:hypothetical protein NEIRO03_2629 [Nematocida sp. AWRm78]|nr:hypothetical protein NEIRO02_2631 [Nematocida sp. AWRm79]KAI5187907.1 hypothetical protein NEIRO03_2629 [Nematocida sp. AWRm78]
MKRNKSSAWLNNLIIIIINIMKHIILPFDIKAVLVIGVEYVLEYIYSIIHSKYKIKESTTEITRNSEITRNIPRKSAVLLDGTSKYGSILCDKLINQGYSVIYPDETSTHKEYTVPIPIKIRNEDSIDIFIKKVSQKSIDLLVINSSECKLSKDIRIRPIKGIEKKIIPSKEKKGFINKNELYKDRSRILLEKDYNAKKNYLFNFLLIRGFADKLKSGNGMVIICTHRIFNLVKKPPVFIPSYLFSYCYSQLLSYFLGIGAKSRYNYLDVRIISCSFMNELWTDYVIHSINKTKKRTVQYFNGLSEEHINSEYFDSANDVWENAEMIS